MAIDGYIIQVDTTDIKEMTKALGSIGRNINQIAKRVNAGGPTYQADMEEILERMDQIWQLLCGLPFGIHRMCVWIVPGGDSLGGGAALFVLNFVIGGIIGGFVLVWRLLVAAWYVPLTIYRLIVGY